VEMAFAELSVKKIETAALAVGCCPASSTTPSAAAGGSVACVVAPDRLSAAAIGLLGAAVSRGSFLFCTFCVSVDVFRGPFNVVEFIGRVFPMVQLLLPQHLMIFALLDPAIFVLLVADRYFGALASSILFATI
jgi:hypothetical protein